MRRCVEQHTHMEARVNVEHADPGSIECCLIPKLTWMRRLTVRWGAGRIPGAADWECMGGGLPLSLRKVSNEAADLFNSKESLKGTSAVQCHPVAGKA